MTALAADTRTELQRWMLSGAIVLMAHGAFATALVHWRDIEPDAPSSAIVIDLAPMPIAPANVPQDIPPGPEQVQAESVPEKPPIEKLEEVPELEPAVAPEMVTAALPQEVKPELPTPQDQAPAPVTTAPQAPKVDEAPVAAAPSQGQLNISNSTAVPAWKRQVVGLLERNKRYPSAAQVRSEQGTVQLAFSLDRQGRVMASHIVKSSGSAALDKETLELVQRAQPFPAPPSEMPGAQITLTVPIRFNMK
ncbi:MAG: periplasmic protein TonB [Alphaproteobacteria bacterium]|jgi:protein TonB|nr:periplasmic protein TonB [Alphaproteobacteria bacterium]